MEGTTLELKYCERCGGLGLRRPGSTDNYCEACARVLTRQVRWMGRGRRGARCSVVPEITRSLRLRENALCVSPAGVLA
jgi:hypothetical protein